MEIYVRQVRHWKFPRWRPDNANEKEYMLPQLFSSRHRWKVWVCAKNPVVVSPYHHKFLQQFFPMREIVFIILLLFLIPFRLNSPELHHNPRSPACRILNLCPILRLPVHIRIHRKTQIYPMTTLSIPPRYGLIITYEIQSIEELCAILIKISNRVFGEFPPMRLIACTLTSQTWLMYPSNMPPHHIKTVIIHAGIDKSRSRPVLWLIDSRPQAVPVSKL